MEEWWADFMFFTASKKEKPSEKAVCAEVDCETNDEIG